LSYVLILALLGSVLATLLSSAGPCYYGQVTRLPDPYEPLMHHLRDTNESFPVTSLDLQEIIWSYYTSGRVAPYFVISALRSMHGGLAVLFALVGWQANRWVGIGLTLFAVMIQVGSVHLGWHYAIDGYVGAFFTILIWQLVGWCLGHCHRSEDRRSVRQAAA